MKEIGQAIQTISKPSGNALSPPVPLVSQFYQNIKNSTRAEC